MKKFILLLFTVLSISIQSQSITRLLVVSNFDNTLRVLDTATYAQIASKTMTFSLGSFQGIHGLAKKPSTGVFYGVVNNGSGARYLASINPVTGSITSIGLLGDSFSQLTFNGNSTLLGVTGSGASVPNTVYRINTSNAAKSSVAQLNNLYGQVICYNPSDNRVYHWTGGNSVTFNSYDTSFASSTNITIGASSSEVTSAVYKTGGLFTTSDWDLNYRKIRATGGSTVYTYYGGASYYPKGMAYITCPRSITTGTYCANRAPVTLTMSGTPGATYQWFKNNVAIVGATLVSLPTATSGVGYYKCRISDGCGTDSLAAGITVSVVPVPTVAVSGSTLLCSGLTLTLTGSSGGTSQWYKNGVIVSGATTNTIAINLPGVYNMIKTNLNGCSDSASVGRIVVSSISPTVSVNSGSICSGNSFTMTASGAATYTFSNGSAIATPTSNVSYSVVGTSSAGCLSTNTAVSSVTVNITPTVSVNNGSICAGQAFTLVPSGANTYTRSGGSAVVTPTTKSVYNIIGLSAQGCVSSNTAVSNVTVNATPLLTVNSGSICSGNSFTMSPSGAATYTFSNGSAITTPSISASYSITGTSSLGCVSSNTAISNVTVNLTPTVSSNSGTICLGQTFTISPIGGNTYTITGGASIVSPSVNTSYSIVGSSSVGCVSSNTAVSNVTVNSLPNITVNSGTICSGSSFTITPSGASTYSVSGGLFVVSPTSNTTYSVTGTGTNGCVSANGVTCSVNVNSLPTISVNSGSICSGQSFTIVPSGASTYTFSSGSAVVTPSATISYTIDGTDAQGCISASSAISTIIVNSLPTVTASSSNSTICIGETCILSANGAATYVWNTNANSATISITPTITTLYSVIGTDANGCVNSFSISQNVAACTGVSEADSSDGKISMYPNPTSGLFYINLVDNARVTVVSILGAVIQDIDMSKGTNLIDLSERANGLYMVSVQSNGKKLNLKLIKE